MGLFMLCNLVAAGFAAQEHADATEPAERMMWGCLALLNAGLVLLYFAL